jgi:ABC-type multidrug transport system permease subunit
LSGSWRWLLLKDLQVLRRSPLLLALLVLYPVVVALLIGFAFNRGPERPVVAFVDELPRGERLVIGGRQLELFGPPRQLSDRIDVVRARSRADALASVRDGEALAALVVPRDTIDKLESQLERPTLRVFLNEENPLKARAADDAIASLVAEANRRLSRAFTEVSLGYLDLLLRGGDVTLLGQQVEVLGLVNVERIARAASRRLPRGAPERRELQRVARFASLARENLDLTDEVLASVGEPIRVRKELLSGSTLPLTSFAGALAVSFSLMFVTVLLASGSIALEASERVLPRLLQARVGRVELLLSKVTLAVGLSVVVTLLMLLGLALFVPLEWERFHLWLLAVPVAAAAFAALGIALGALAPDVSTASLLAFTVLLPVAFLALVPSGVVGTALYDAARVVSAVFPFDPAFDALRSALYGRGGIAAPLVHLAALAAGWGVVARVGLARLA